MNRITWLSLLFSFSTAVGAQSMGGPGMMGASPGDSGMSSMMGSGGSATDHMSGTRMDSASGMLVAGEVRKVNRDAQKITIKHGPIENLGMPPMTMVFRAQNAAMLDQVKAGDKVRFRAENINGQFTLTRIEREQ